MSCFLKGTRTGYLLGHHRFVASEHHPEQKLWEFEPPDPPLTAQADDYRTLRPPEETDEEPFERKIWFGDHGPLPKEPSPEEPIRLFSSNAEDGAGMSLLIEMVVGQYRRVEVSGHRRELVYHELWLS